MITGLSGATIWSEDLNNLLPFYRDVVGLPVAHETPGFVVLGEFGKPTLALGTHSDVKGKNADPARHMVGFECDDAMAEAARLKANGATFLADPSDQGPVIVGTFIDPDGNYNQLLQFK